MDYYYYDDDQMLENGVDQVENYEYDSILLGEETFTDLYTECIKASTVQVQQYIVILLGCGLMLKVLWEVIRRVQNNDAFYHLISIASGLFSLWLYVGSKTSYVVLHILHVCIFMRLVVGLKIKRKGLFLIVYTIVCQIFLEFLMGQELYETIRGPQMVVSMKIISIAYDIQDGGEQFKWFPMWGYMLCPSTSILGPWTSFGDYKPKNTVTNIRQLIVRILSYIVLSVVFLNLSNCIIPWLKHLWNGGLWCRTFLDALSVRCSHYFICYLSHAALQINCSPQNSSSNDRSYCIVKPSEIEFPRSLSQAIRHWNIPMHVWLKRYVFLRMRLAKYPYFFAVLSTYLVSCLVHGFNYKVHLILVSIGVFSYFENSLRRTLAAVFNACIDSASCTHNCKYLYCPRSRRGLSLGNVLVRSVNLMFSFFVMLQLAYLGVMLNSNSSSASSPVNILQIWRQLKFFGHCLASAMAFFYIAI